MAWEILFVVIPLGVGIFIGRWTKSNSSTGKAVEAAANKVVDEVKKI